MFKAENVQALQIILTPVGQKKGGGGTMFNIFEIVDNEFNFVILNQTSIQRISMCVLLFFCKS